MDTDQEFKTIPGLAVLHSLQDGGMSKNTATSLARRAAAQKSAVLLLGSFRKTDVDDPEIYTAAIQHVLQRYEPDVQQQAIRPGKWKWLPSAYEIREACEIINATRAENIYREELVHETLTKRHESAKELTPEEQRIAHVAKMRSEGRLTFKNGSKDKTSWFDSLTVADVEKNFPGMAE